MRDRRAAADFRDASGFFPPRPSKSRTPKRPRSSYGRTTKERDVKYLCLAYGDQSKMEALSKTEFEALVAKCGPMDEEMRRAGKILMTESLEWATTTIRTRNGEQVVTDGPFVESKEKVGGLFIVEARDLNEAIRIASMHPAARLGEDRGWGLEVRPIASGCHQ
jgi:hypothetical protein